MADTLGLLQLPALATDSPIGDPTLNVLLQFFKQTLTNQLTAVWAAACPNVAVVKTIAARDPSELTLTTTELPALFLDRTQGWDTPVWEAADYERVPSKLRLWWVLPRLELKWRRQRATVMQAAQAALLFAIDHTARAPGLVFPGDTDPDAGTKGSVVWKFAPIWHLWLKKCGPQKLTLEVDKAKQVFDAVVWNFDLSERLKQDPTQHSSPLAGMDDSISNGDAAGDAGLPLITISANIRLSSIAPNTGSHLGGTVITLTGTEFAAGATVTVGGNQCTFVTWLDATRVQATTPAGIVGAATVLVTNPGGESASITNAFTYT